MRKLSSSPSSIGTDRLEHVLERGELEGLVDVDDPARGMTEAAVGTHDDTTHGVADHERRVEVERVDDGAQVAGHGDRVVRGQPLGLAVTAHVDAHHPPTRGQRVGDRIPRRVVTR